MRTPDISAGISHPNVIHVYWCGATYIQPMGLIDNNKTLLTGAYSIFLVNILTRFSYHGKESHWEAVVNTVMNLRIP
jgi:hypothetical protein